MVTSLNFSVVKTPQSLAPRNSLHICQPLRQQQLQFTASVGVSFSLTGSLGTSHTSRNFRVKCSVAKADVLERGGAAGQNFSGGDNQLTCVMKFGGSSVSNAGRMREVADLICSFPNERPVIVLSAMGKTTNNLLLVYSGFLFLLLYGSYNFMDSLYYC